MMCRLLPPCEHKEQALRPFFSGHFINNPNQLRLPSDRKSTSGGWVRLGPRESQPRVQLSAVSCVTGETPLTAANLSFLICKVDSSRTLRICAS